MHDVFLDTGSEVRPDRAGIGVRRIGRAHDLAVFRDRPLALQYLHGIGPKFASVMNEAGIFTFAQMAATSVERLEEIIAASGVRAPSNPGTWPEQAELAAKGDWDALEKLQGKLKGGRRA